MRPKKPPRNSGRLGGMLCHARSQVSFTHSSASGWLSKMPSAMAWQ